MRRAARLHGLLCSTLRRRALSTDGRHKRLGSPCAVYVHWPYCESLCSYCDFNKYLNTNVDHERMRSALVRELKTQLAEVPQSPVTSVFFGGGTPSIARPSTFHAIIEAVHGHNSAAQPLAPSLHSPAAQLEVTMEINPTSVRSCRSLLSDFKDAGITRASIGVQALNDADLKFLTRRHTVAESLETVSAASAVFGGATSVDLMYGRPGQGVSGWEDELRAVSALGVPHLSLYELTLKKGTALQRAVAKGEVVLSEHMEELFEANTRILAPLGYNQYEVSSFARAGHECAHNMAYWTGRDYIGVGPGAHGRFTPYGPDAASRQRVHRVCVPSPDQWMRQVEMQGHGVRKQQTVSQLESLGELLATALRTSRGLTSEDWDSICLRSGQGVERELSLADFLRAAGAEIERLEGAGLVEVGRGDTAAGGLLRPTQRGMALVDAILPSLLLVLEQEIS